jgi:hypothetical protein
MDSLINRKVSGFLSRRCSTLLGVGPMSLNCVDAAIQVAQESQFPLFMIASRRQIDSEDFGGGYVNNWTTQHFANYVINRDKRGKILLARDHGGPWQNEKEKSDCLGLRKAMESAKKSFKADIDAGFQLLHIDTCVDIHSSPSVDDALDRLYELYEFCSSYAIANGHDIAIEIGTEEQSGVSSSHEELDYVLSEVNKFCKNAKLPPPLFVVVQTGTRVMEMRNIGSFDSPLRVANELPAEIQLPRMIQVCNDHGVFLKEHNADYLSDEALHWHPRLGIHAINVAPEFGVCESKELVHLFEMEGLDYLAERFLALSYDSRKWEKWIIPDSKLTDRDRAIICGHYIFSTPEFEQIKRQASAELLSKNISLDERLRLKLESAIFRYIKQLRLL